MDFNGQDSYTGLSVGQWVISSLARSIFCSVFASKQDNWNVDDGWNAAALVYIAFMLSNFLSGCRLLAFGSKKKPKSCNAQGQAAVLGDFEIGTKVREFWRLLDYHFHVPGCCEGFCWIWFCCWSLWLPTFRLISIFRHLYVLCNNEQLM